MRGLWYDCRVSGLCATTQNRVLHKIETFWQYHYTQHQHVHFGMALPILFSDVRLCAIRFVAIFRDVRNPFALCPSLSICVTELHYLLCLSLLIHILIHPSIHPCMQSMNKTRTSAINNKIYVRNTLNVYCRSQSIDVDCSILNGIHSMQNWPAHCCCVSTFCCWMCVWLMVGFSVRK